MVPRLLGSLVGGAMSPTQHLEQQQALVKQFAEILEFVLKFDEHKVSSQPVKYISCQYHLHCLFFSVVAIIFAFHVYDVYTMCLQNDYANLIELVLSLVITQSMWLLN